MIKDDFLNDRTNQSNYKINLKYDLPAGIVVFLVALPLCLGIALASGAPLFSGLIAGIIGGIIVSGLSGSALGISGPAAGLSVIAYATIQELGYESFLLTVVLAGLIQLIMGRLGAGIVGYYFPSAVVTGMLAGIGIIIFLKQIPHTIGYDSDYEGDLSFLQGDDYTTFSELSHMLQFISPGAVIISLVCLAILLLWETHWLKKFRCTQWFHGALIAVIAGTLINQAFIAFYPAFALRGMHLVLLPTANELEGFINFLTLPDFSQITNPAVYPIALTIAIVASLETLLCVEAVDKLDPHKRVTPNNRELKAQGIGNICSGLLGGLPITQVIVRSSTNIQSGAQTKASAFLHGLLLLFAVLLIPEILNTIPIASLAVILLMVGYKMAKPSIFKKMFQVGPSHFVPFMATVLGLVFTDMLTGISAGMGIAVFFILLENLKIGYYLHEHRNVNKTIISLSENVTFLNKANLLHLLNHLPDHSEVVIDATSSKYIDYDVYEIIENFKIEAQRKHIKLFIENLRGFGVLEPVKPALPASKEIQEALKPDDVLDILKSGNQRFVHNLKSHQNLLEQVNRTVDGQFPIAIILSCIDSRTSAELIFNQGLGDIFSVRVAGNVVNDDILGSMEFACKLAGSKLIVVLGHSHCGAVSKACSGAHFEHITGLLNKIEPAITAVKKGQLAKITKPNASLEEKVSERHVELMVEQIKAKSLSLKEMVASGDIGIIGAMYDIETGHVSFYDSPNALT